MELSRVKQESTLGELGGLAVNALTEFLFPAPARRTVGGIVRWWESRRIHYNLIVGGAGVFSMGAFRVLSSLPPDPHRVHYFLAPIIAFGVLANLCYLLGPAAEIAVEKLSHGKILPTGPVLYRMGLTFSVGLVLLPTLLAGLEWGFRILRWVF